MLPLSFTEKALYFFCGLGILQGFLLALLVYFHPKADKSVNTFLGLYICAISFVMALPLLMETIGWQNSFFLMPMPFLPGPFLYFYLLSFKQTITWKKIVPHFILFLVVFLVAKWNLSEIVKLYPSSPDLPVQALRRPVTLLVALTRSLQQLFYFFLARQTLVSYQHSIVHLFSETSRIDLGWAKFLVYGYLVLILTFIVIFPLILRNPEQFKVLLLINMAVATPYIYIASYKGVAQPTIWQLQPGEKKEVVEEQMHEVEEIEKGGVVEIPRAEKTRAGSDKVGEIVRKITRLMEVEKLYQEPELTLQQLAAKLEVPTYQVSQVLNEAMKKNFYDLVNGYRVEEAKRLLLDSKNRNYTVLSVGFEAGFNSKTTFNTVFKKFTGLTPTEFRQTENSVAIG